MMENTNMNCFVPLFVAGGAGGHAGFDEACFWAVLSLPAGKFVGMAERADRRKLDRRLRFDVKTESLV